MNKKVWQKQYTVGIIFLYNQYLFHYQIFQYVSYDLNGLMKHLANNNRCVSKANSNESGDNIAFFRVLKIFYNEKCNHHETIRVICIGVH